MEKQIYNSVFISGIIENELTFNHEVFGEKFYSSSISIKRDSGKFDSVPILISDRLIDFDYLKIGTHVSISGQFRSFNCHNENKHTLILSVFVNEIQIDEDEFLDSNIIELTGYLCKNPVYRQTPLGREIADILVAVNRSYGKSDYIPCIAWGRNARYASGLDIGMHIKVFGRIQSREYQKCISDTETETKTAYEVSVSRIELVY